MEHISIERDGLRLTGPRKPKRNDYVRVTVKIVTDQFDDAKHEGRGRFDAWAFAVNFASQVYGPIATEDGTIGQHAQLDGVDGSKREMPVKGRVFELGLNLYGRKIREVWTRIDRYVTPATGIGPGFVAPSGRPF